MCCPFCSNCGNPLVERIFSPIGGSSERPAPCTTIACAEAERSMTLCEHCVTQYAAHYPGSLPSMLKALLRADPAERHGTMCGKKQYAIAIDQFIALRDFLTMAHAQAEDARAQAENGAAEARDYLKTRMCDAHAEAIARVLGREAVGKTDTQLLTMLAPLLERVPVHYIKKRPRDPKAE